MKLFSAIAASVAVLASAKLEKLENVGQGADAKEQQEAQLVLQKTHQVDRNLYRPNPYNSGELLYGESTPEHKENAGAILKHTPLNKKLAAVGSDKKNFVRELLYHTVFRLQNSIWDADSCGDTVVAAVRNKEHILKKLYTRAVFDENDIARGDSSNVNVVTSLIINPDEAQLWGKALMTAVENEQAPFDLCTPDQRRQYMDIYASAAQIEDWDDSKTEKNWYPLVILALIVLLLGVVVLIFALKAKKNKKGGDAAEETGGDDAAENP